MQGWGWNGFRDHGVKAAQIQTVKVLGWDNEGDVAVERLSLVLQFKSALARDSHGCRTMKVRDEELVEDYAGWSSNGFRMATLV